MTGTKYDILYTWVDDSFPGFQEQRAQYATDPEDLNPAHLALPVVATLAANAFDAASLRLLAPADTEKHYRDYEKDYPKERHPAQEMIL